MQQNGDVQAAYEVLLDGLRHASGPHHTWLELGESLYIRDVWVLLTIYAYILKKYIESAAYAAIAYKNCPHDETVQFNWKVCCEVLQKQLTEANLYGTN